MATGTPHVNSNPGEGDDDGWDQGSSRGDGETGSD